MSEALQKQLLARIKKMRCEQQNCRSNKQQNLQIAIVDDGQYKKKGIMCTSCFIDQQLITSLQNVQMHALSIQKFLKVLAENYKIYAENKNKPDWPPTQINANKIKIKQKVNQLDKLVSKGIQDITKYLENSTKQALEKIKQVNHQKNLQKLLNFINEEDQTEQQRMNITNQLKEVSIMIVQSEGKYKLVTQNSIKKKNQMILVQFKRKAMKAKQSIMKLVQIHKKCLKYLIE